MVSRAPCLWTALLFTLAASELMFEPRDCPVESVQFFDNMCLLEQPLHRCSCVARCKLHVQGEDSVRVAEGTECRCKSGTMICSEGGWTSPGQPHRRVKRGWLFWSSSSSEETQYPPEITCPGDITVTAPNGRTSARVTWTVPTASDPNGGTPSVTLTEGQDPGSWFSEGQTLIEYTARDHTGRQSSCSFIIHVHVIYCPDSQRRSFGPPGVQSCQGGDTANVYGSQCTHSCPVGHYLSGTSSVTCQSNGQWSSAFPQCHIVSCGEPPAVASGNVSCPAGHTYSQSCVLQCRAGYTSMGHSLTVCNSNGLWSTTLGPCIDTEPPDFPHGCPPDQSLFSGPLQSPVAVTWTNPAVTDNGPDPVTLTSDPAKGSRLGVGVHTVTVAAEDRAGNKASCSFRVTIVAKECPPIVQPTNGFVICTRGHVEGSECTTGCHEGYKVQGGSVVTCLGTRQWDSETPTCEAVECPAPPEVEHASSFLCLQGHQFPGQCSLTCDPGYSVVGAATIQCQANQTWTQHGNCRDTQLPNFITPCPSDLDVYSSRFGEETHVTWSPLEASDTSGYDVNVTCDVASGASFPPGETTVTCMAVDISGNSRSCRFSVNVTVLQCPHPGTFLNNQSQVLFTCPDDHVYGAKCTLGCVQGYSLFGEAALGCEREVDTHPPVMAWKGTDGELMTKPECKVDNCPRLEPPKDGSLSCLLGPVAWDCFLQCHDGWDVSARSLRFDGYLVCNTQQGFWRPPFVPDCVVRRRPWRLQVYSDLFYITEDCVESKAIIRDRFITRLTTSILRDACVGLPTCAARNVKVTCGPVSQWDRRKRAVDQRFQSPEGQNGDSELAVGGEGTVEGSHYVLLSFEVTISDLLRNSSLSDTQLYKTAQQTTEVLTQSLVVEATSGRLSLTHVRADVSKVTRPSVRVHCPPGTLLRPLDLSADRYSCVGCSRGHCLSPGDTQCRPCPRGHFAPGDSATSCLPCPPGMTTPSTGAPDVSLCQPVTGH